MELLNKVTTISSVFSPLLFLIVLISVWKKGLLTIDKIVVSIVIISFATDLAIRYLIEGRNYVYLSIYMIVEMFLVLYYYQKVLIKRNLLIVVMLLIFLSTAIIECFSKNPVSELLTYSLTVKCLIFIILSLSFFYQIYTREEDIFKRKAPDFWYNVGFLIYFSLAFFPFFLATEIMKGWLDYPVWYVHNIGNILKNIIFALGLWMVQKR